MLKDVNDLAPHLGTVILGCACVYASSIAAPAQIKAPVFSRIAAESAGSSMAAGQSHVMVGRLDLRPPTVRDFADISAQGSVIATEGAHNDGRRFPRTRMASDSDFESSPPGLGDLEQPHRTGRVQSFAEHFHREGLPIARLWENHAAMVTLGLNGKGKPGLWLVQKIH